MTDLWIFVEHSQYHTWTRAIVPRGIETVRELITYLQRGGQIESNWLDLPERAHYVPRAVGMTVIASLG